MAPLKILAFANYSYNSISFPFCQYLSEKIINITICFLVYIVKHKKEASAKRLDRAKQITEDPFLLLSALFC